MARVFIGVGSNEGERLAQLSKAIQRLGSVAGIDVVQMATIQETEPMGGPPQARFLNTVVEIETTHSPRELLAILKCVEGEHGRCPGAQRWGPRPIDLDILLYEQRIVHEADLAIPHEQMHARRFVLEPLAQLAPDLIHPILGQTIAQLLHRLSDSPPAPRATPTGPSPAAASCA